MFNKKGNDKYLNMVRMKIRMLSLKWWKLCTGNTTVLIILPLGHSTIVLKIIKLTTIVLVTKF